MAKVFVQARMSSKRFPGKVLHPFLGRPIIDHVLAAASKGGDVVLVTSVEPSDDALAAHAEAQGVPVFRGPLDDVLGRFVAALDAHPCDWVFRVCADSPLLDPSLFQLLLPQAGPEVDVVTNVFPRTFPAGHSLELLSAAALRKLHAQTLSEAEREHVTLGFYNRPEAFRIANVTRDGPPADDENLCIDTRDDLERLEAQLQRGGMR